MKPQSIVLILTLILASALSANAQCGMMGSGSHKHGGDKTSTHGDHEKQKAAETSKGYSIINDDGIQEATIVIKDGYQPGTLIVKKNIPLKLNFDVQEEGCTGTVVFKDFDIEQELEPYKLTSVEFTPATSGSFTFACPMNMIEGTLIVKE